MEGLPVFPSPFTGFTRIQSSVEVRRARYRLMPTPRTVLQKTLDSFTGAVREKSRWWQKVNDESVVSRWRQEAQDQNISSPMFEFALQQLRHQATEFVGNDIEPSAVWGVFQSDSLLDAELCQALADALQPLRDVPEVEKDWHPRSENQVLDLVHPSLFPLVYGLSRRIPSESPTCGEQPHDSLPSNQHTQTPNSTPSSPGRPAPTPFTPADQEVPPSAAPPTDTGRPDSVVPHARCSSGAARPAAAGDADAPQPHSAWKTRAFDAWLTCMGSGDVIPASEAPAEGLFASSKFQWLPAEVLVGADGRVAFDSYVNNLHPGRHAALYAATARLLERMRPLLERTLALAALPPERVVEEGDTEDKWDLQTEADVVAALRRLGEMLPNGALASAPEEVLDEDDLWELRRERRRWLGPALPDAYVPQEAPPVVDLKGRGLQVVVKYAEIVLTPERPEYGGGVWHVEGMENEAIVASCIAYLSADNISESRLHFRSFVEDPEYEQNDWDGVENMYGMVDEEPVNDPLGSALCAPGRMLCWPNALQHRVAPFRLADASRPGRRTIAVAFLVDPNTRVLSTRDVPPQQMAWHDAASRLGSLVPEEVKARLDALREFPISLEHAKELRLELMEERGKAVQAANEEIYERVFSLCEH